MAQSNLLMRSLLTVGFAINLLFDQQVSQAVCTSGCGSITEVSTPVVLEGVSGTDSPNFPARIAGFASSMSTKWRAGDIAFVGDSLTEFTRRQENDTVDHMPGSINPWHDPLVPPSHNLAMSGAKIANVVDLIETLFLDNAPDPICDDPSQIHVLVGANNIHDSFFSVGGNTNSFDCNAEADYRLLFGRLAQIKSTYNCRIIIHSNLPGQWDDANINDAIYNQEIQYSNEFLEYMTSQYGFEYLELFSSYWDNGQTNTSYYLDQGNAFIHLNRTGVKVRLERLAPILFPPLPMGVSTNLSTLTSKPSARPRTTLSSPPEPTTIKYRYATATIPPHSSLNIQVNGSAGDNYVGIFNPTNPTPQPVDSCLQSGAPAQACIDNDSSAEKVVVVAMGGTDGAGNIGGYVEPDVEPFNNSAFMGGSSTDTALDYMPDISSDEDGNLLAVWYKQVSPGSAPVLVYSESTNDGVSWPAAAAVSRGITLDIRAGANASPPRIACGELSGNNQWRVIYPSRQGVRVAHLASNNTWDGEALPPFTSCSPLTVPHIVHRAEHDDKWIASWIGQKHNSDCSCNNKTLYVAIRSTDSSFPWTAFDGAVLPSELGGDQIPCANCPTFGTSADSIMTAIRKPEPEEGYPSSSVWLEKTGTETVVRALVFESVYVSTDEVVNPQIAWFEETNQWIVAWSARSHPGYGSDLDVFYRKWSASTETWGSVQALSPSTATTDTQDDILEQLVTQNVGLSPKVGMLVRRVTETQSDLYIKDSTDAATWSSANTVGSPASGANFTNGRMAAAEDGDWLVISQATGTGYGPDSDIVLTRE